eukprot:gene8055-8918_t
MAVVSRARLFSIVLVFYLFCECFGSSPSVNVKIGGKLPKGGSVTATCSANGKKGMQIKWFIIKPQNKIMELAHGSNSNMHHVTKETVEVNSTFVRESVSLTIKYDLMAILSFFKCSRENFQDLKCQGSYKCIADFSPPKKGVYMENMAIVNLDGTIRLPPRAVILSIHTDSTTATVDWNQPRGGEVPILRYEVMYKLKSDFSFTFTPGPRELNTSRQALITNLKPYTEYNIYVVTVLPAELKNSLGKRGPTIEPQNMNAESTGSTYIYLRWQQPRASSWNGPLDGFYITYRRIKHGSRDLTNEKTLTRLVKGTKTRINATDLKPWSTYLITASGFNKKKKDNSFVFGKVGRLNVTTHRAKPSTSPLNLDIVHVSSNSATVKWEAPLLENSNGPIDGYILRYVRTELGYVKVNEESKQNLIEREQSKFYSLTGLLPWSTYSVEVIAYNLFQGKRLESDASHALVIQTLVSEPLSPPKSLSVEKIDARFVLLNWQPPGIEKGSNGPINGYIVKYRRIKLGDKELDSERLEKRFVDKGENSNFNLSALLPWSTYTIQINAFNLLDGRHNKLLSPPTEPFIIKTRVCEPEISSTRFKSFFTSSRYASLSWLRPSPEKAHGPIDGYVIHYKRIKSGSESLSGNITVQSRDVSGRDESFRLDQLKPWSTYDIDISSYNNLNDKRLYSRRRSKWTIVTEVDKPNKSPSILKTVEVGSDFIKVEWERLKRADQNGPLDGYEVFYERTAVGMIKSNQTRPKKEGVPGTEQVYKLTQLSPWGSYNIWVLAYNLKDNEKLQSSIGEVFSTQTKTARPSSSPSSVEIPTWSAKSITISWSSPKFEDLNGELIGFVIRVNSTATVTAKNASNDRRSRREVAVVSRLYNVSKSETMYKLKDLKPATKYSLEVAAATNVGTGPFSKPIYRTTREDAPTAPINLRVLSRQSLLPVTITWTIPEHPNGKITRYSIEVFKVGPNSTVTYTSPGTKTVFNITKLDSGNKYLFRVRATTVRAGKWSQWAVMFVPPVDANLSEQKGESPAMSFIVPVVVGVVLLVCFIIAIAMYKRLKVTTYEPGKTQEKARLTNIDIEMEGMDENQHNSEKSRMLDDSDVTEDDTQMADKVWSDEDEKMNSNETAKIPCSTPPPSSLPCHPAHPPISVERFQDHVNDLRKSDCLKLKEDYKDFKVGQIYTWDIAMKPKNKIKNRYANIVAYDHSRVILKPIPGDTNGSDYINACYIDGYHYPEEYIATQGPMEDTTNDFWRLIWQERSTTIVCLTNLHELGKSKCYQYWPSVGRVRHGGIVITLVSTEKTADYIIRTMDIRHDQSDEVRQVCQFHFLSWPDHGAPVYPTPLLSLRRRIRHYYDGKTPMVLHCSAGVGRTGCFILIDEMLERSGREATVDIYNYLHYLRTRRINMVQTDEQYMFVHEAILEALQCGNTEMLAKDLPIMLKKYKNVGKDGMTHHEREFKKLLETCPEIKWEECSTALQPENLRKSRSLNIIARDADRIVLKPDLTAPDANYINAVFIDGYKDRNAFIVTEAPMDSTIPVLWRMIYEKGCRTIVTYPCFWPADEGEKAAETYGSFSVKMISEQMDGDIFSKRLNLTSEKGDSREVQLLQYVAWPYHDVPDSKRDILALISRVEESQRRLGNSPILVMCSDGAGRSGTFVGIYNCIERVKVEQLIDVFQCVRSVRLIRPLTVATVDQMKFIYEMVMEYLNSFDTYGNFS